MRPPTGVLGGAGTSPSTAGDSLAPRGRTSTALVGTIPTRAAVVRREQSWMAVAS
jgi:hypothetical protein